MADALIGKCLGNFTITGVLGAGAMGTVYRGEHSVLNYAVAIKVMRSPGPAAKQLQSLEQRFISEAEALAKASSNPHIVKLFDFGQTDQGQLYYAMEYLEGRTLSEELVEQGALRAPEAWPYLQQICDGLHAAHQCGIVHRDLKPDNIFVVAGNSLQIKLLDFGIAKLLYAPSLTTGAIGSPLYAAPEQVQGHHDRIGPATDIYSLAVVTYEMLSGESPFRVTEDMSAREVMGTTAAQQPTSLRDNAPHVSAGLAALVHRCLSKDPGARPQTAVEFSQAMARWCRGSNNAATLAGTAPGLSETVAGKVPPPDPSTSQLKRSIRRPSRLALVLSAAAALVGLAVLGASQLRGTESQTDATPHSVRATAPSKRSPAELRSLSLAHSVQQQRDRKQRYEISKEVRRSARRSNKATRPPHRKVRKTEKLNMPPTDGSSQPKPQPEEVVVPTRAAVNSRPTSTADTERPVR